MTDFSGHGHPGLFMVRLYRAGSRVENVITASAITGVPIKPFRRPKKELILAQPTARHAAAVQLLEKIFGPGNISSAAASYIL